jgi:hypothetical protein
MSGAAFTPGPWAWGGDFTLRPVNPDPTRSAVHTILSPDGCFGFVDSDPAATLAEAERDRRLIAAAPELLDALRMAHRLILRVAEAEGLADGSESPTMQAIEGAIAKATRGAP